MNNEQKPASPETSSSTTQPSTTSFATASGERSAERLAAANSKIPSIILHTPIVSIASGTMSKSTTTTTSTKTTPTAHSTEELLEAMANNLAKHDSVPVQRDDGSIGFRGQKKAASTNTKSTSKSVTDSDKRKSYSPPISGSNSTINSHNNPSGSGCGIGSDSSTTPVPSLSASTSASASEVLSTSSNITTPEEAGAANFVYSFLDDTSKLEGPTRRRLQYGVGATGKTQDDQNVGKRQKKKKIIHGQEPHNFEGRIPPAHAHITVFCLTHTRTDTPTRLAICALSEIGKLTDIELSRKVEMIKNKRNKIHFN